MNRLEEGQQAYTIVEDGRLIHVGWLMERPTQAFVARHLPRRSLRPNQALIVDLTPLCPEREAELRWKCLWAMLDALSQSKGISHAVISRPPMRGFPKAFAREMGFQPLDGFEQCLSASG